VCHVPCSTAGEHLNWDFRFEFPATYAPRRSWVSVGICRIGSVYSIKDRISNGLRATRKLSGLEVRLEETRCILISSNAVTYSVFTVGA
jgi:hypothetical protein